MPDRTQERVQELWKDLRREIEMARARIEMADLDAAETHRDNAAKTLAVIAPITTLALKRENKSDLEFIIEARRRQATLDAVRYALEDMECEILVALSERVKLWVALSAEPIFA